MVNPNVRRWGGRRSPWHARQAASRPFSLLFAVAVHARIAQSNTPDIVVTPSRTDEPIQRAGSAVTVITADEIEQSSVRDVGDLLRRSPGLTVTQNGGPGQIQTVRMRGGESRHTLVLIDGIRVNDPSTTGREFDFSTLVLADVERIEVLRGPQSALYGSDAMGGVMNIITRKGGGAAPRPHLGRGRQLRHQGDEGRHLGRRRPRRLRLRLCRLRHGRLLRLRLPHPAPALSRALGLRAGQRQAHRRHRPRRRQRLGRLSGSSSAAATASTAPSTTPPSCRSRIRPRTRRASSETSTAGSSPTRSAACCAAP